MWDVLQSKMVRRQVPLKNLKPGKVEPRRGATVRQVIAIQNGLTADMAREIVKVHQGRQAQEGAVRDPGRHGAHLVARARTSCRA